MHGYKSCRSFWGSIIRLSILPTLISSACETHKVMGMNIKCFIFLNILFNALASDEASNNSKTESIQLLQTDQKNNGSDLPLPPRDYGDIGDKRSESIHDSGSVSYKSKPQSGGDYPIFNEYTGNGQLNNYGLPIFPSITSDIKGYPFSVPSWITPDHMMQMMAAIKNVSGTTKPAETGLFSKLITDPKIAAAAFLPLSIVAAAIVPVLMNYVMDNSSLPTVSTTANNRGFRSLDVPKNLDVVLESMSRFARAMENDECIQMTICRVLSGEDDAPDSHHAKKVALTLTQWIGDDWSNKLGIREIINGVNKDKCSNVCKDSTRITKRT
ncbi:uncharacterized protein NPIL_191291 [Nephila pilipes]|uniref:Uncharacterized protein n=1 Tax=Nephila pilipes TaxID=299642 RepID=A0A8X6NGN6_NEPPI|nr:uncharacterized protein NPIL_191291 [Nephila pilipes]